MSIYYAHSGHRADRADWQLLREHLANVARLAEDFARAACPADDAFISTAKIAGWLHDLGKYRTGFQTLLDCRFDRRPLTVPREQTFHKQAGAARTARAGNVPVAFAIAGHHGGIPDRAALASLIKSPLATSDAAAISAAVASDCPPIAALSLGLAGSVDALGAEFLTRIIFSCLIDADWTDSSIHERSVNMLPLEPAPPRLNPADRLAVLLQHIQIRAKSCQRAIATIRDEVLQACLSAAEKATGLFSLTVPTGGGKTLSGLAFALRHAALNGLRRIIYVAPYLTILEQNAAVIREGSGSAVPISISSSITAWPSPMAATMATRRRAARRSPRRELGRAADRHDQRAVLREPVFQSAVAMPKAAQHRP